MIQGYLLNDLVDYSASRHWKPAGTDRNLIEPVFLQGDIAGKKVEAHLIALYTARHPDWETELSAWLASSEFNLHRLCTSRLGNAVDAEDAVQEITLKVIRALPRFNGQSALRTWVISIVENHCRSMIRQRNVRTIGNQLQHCLISFETERRSHVDAFTLGESTDEVHNTLQRLSDKYRIILELRFFEGFSIAQMANALDLSLSAAKMRLYRAMDAFRQKHLSACS